MTGPGTLFGTFWRVPFGDPLGGILWHHHPIQPLLHVPCRAPGWTLSGGVPEHPPGVYLPEIHVFLVALLVMP